MKAPRMRTLLGLVVLTSVLAGCFGAGEEHIDTRPATGTPFSATAVFPGDYDMNGPYARPLAAGPYDVLPAEVVELASDVDGAVIQMGLVRPDVPVGTTVPVIVDASPYYAPLTPARVEENPKNDQVTFWTFDHYDYYVHSFVSHGYAVAFLATRGSGGSGGCWTFYGPAEQADVDQALTWLGAQEWSNGNIGMTGLSFEGTSQWMAAATGNPHLKTIVPIVTSGSDLRKFFVANGTVTSNAITWPWFGTYGLGWDSLALATEPAPFLDTLPPAGRPLDRRLQGVCPDVAQGIAATIAQAATLGTAPFDAFWAARDFQPEILDKYRGTVFIVNGMRDEFDANGNTYPFATQLEENGLVVKHLLGDWQHAYPDYRVFDHDVPPFLAKQDETHKRWDFAEILLRWFDRWLKEDGTVDIGPGAQVQDTLGRWRNEPTWPPGDQRPLALHLAPGGALDATTPDGSASMLLCADGAGALPPETMVACSTLASFETAPMSEGLLFAGASTLRLSVTPAGPGGHVTARLYLVAEDGERRIGHAQTDLRVAHGEPEPRPVVPGERLDVRLRLLPYDVAVPVGGRLRLDIAVGTTLEGLPAAMPLPLTLELGPEQNVLTLPTIERAAEAYFVAPGQPA